MEVLYLSMGCQVESFNLLTCTLWKRNYNNTVSLLKSCQYQLVSSCINRNYSRFRSDLLDSNKTEKRNFISLQSNMIRPWHWVDFICCQVFFSLLATRPRSPIWTPCFSTVAWSLLLGLPVVQIHLFFDLHMQWSSLVLVSDINYLNWICHNTIDGICSWIALTGTTRSMMRMHIYA